MSSESSAQLPQNSARVDEARRWEAFDDGGAD
jgi:hypothetical protein